MMKYICVCEMFFSCYFPFLCFIDCLLPEFGTKHFLYLFIQNADARAKCFFIENAGFNYVARAFSSIIFSGTLLFVPVKVVLLDFFPNAFREPMHNESNPQYDRNENHNYEHK